MFSVYSHCQGCGEDKLIARVVELGEDGREYAERFAAICDGTSPWLRPPGDVRSTTVGRCLSCGDGFIDCRVEP